MQKKWNAFTRKIGAETDDFKTVLDTSREFLTEPFTAVIEREKEDNA